MNTANGRMATVNDGRHPAMRASDLRSLCYFKGVIDLDAKISDRTLKLSMAEQKLYRSQVL